VMSNGVSEAWIAKLRDLNPGWIHGAAHLTHSTGTKLAFIHVIVFAQSGGSRIKKTRDNLVFSI